MRLIDADALKEDIVKLCKKINASNGITVPTLAFTRVIDNAPTVETEFKKQLSIAKWEAYCEGQRVGYEKAISEMEIEK